MVKILQAILLLFLHMKQESYILHDAESVCILPHLIEKSGHKSDRHRTLIKQVISTAAEVVPPAKLIQCLLQGLGSKNKKSRAVSLEEIAHIVEGIILLMHACTSLIYVLFLYSRTHIQHSILTYSLDYSLFPSSVWNRCSW